MKTITRSIGLGVILLWLTNLCFCEYTMSWKKADTFGDKWKEEIAALPAFEKQVLMLLKHKGTDEVYFQGDRVDGNTDYAIADLKPEVIVKIRVTQEEIFRAAAKRHCEHLINVNTKFYKKLPLTDIYFTDIERGLQKYSETIKNISDIPKKEDKFQLIVNLMKKITKLHNITPKYYFESEVTKENLQICAFSFDATALETWAHTHRQYFTGYDGEGESLVDLPEEEVLAAADDTDENETSKNAVKEQSVNDNSPNSSADKADSTTATNSPNISSAGSESSTNVELNNILSRYGLSERNISTTDFCMSHSDMLAWLNENVEENGMSNVNLVSCSNHKTLKRVDGERRFNGAASGESGNRQSNKKPTLDRGYIRKNGFGIAVVIVEGGATAKKVSFFGSHVLVAKCSNSRYLNELVRHKYGDNSWDILQTADWTEFAKKTKGIDEEFEEKMYEKAEMIDFSKDVTTHVTLSFHKKDGTTDYVVVERKVITRENFETKILYRAPQDKICREMAKDMCLDLLRTNRSKFGRFCDWFTKQDKNLVRTIELKKVGETEEGVNRFLQEIVKQFLGATPRPHYKFSLKIYEPDTYIYGIIFDASNGTWDEDIKFINLHKALLDIILKKKEDKLTYDNNAERCAFHENGFGIALVITNDPDFKTAQSQEYASNVLLARVKNQEYLQEILTKDMPNIFLRAGAAVGKGFLKAFRGVKTAVKKKIPWDLFKDWDSEFSYRWADVYAKLGENEKTQDLCLEYGRAKSLLHTFTSPHIHFYRCFMTSEKSLLVVAWIDQDFPDQIIIVKKVVIDPKKVAEEKEKPTKPNLAKRVMTKATSAVNLFTGMISNALSKNPYDKLVSEGETNEKTKGVPKTPVNKDAGTVPIVKNTVMDTNTGLIVEETLEIGCSGYKGWEAVEDKNLHRPLELYLQDFVALYCNLEHHWKILLVKKTNPLSRNKYLMVYGIHYEFLEENMNKPWFAQENYEYFCVLVKKDHKNKLTASRNKGSDPAKKIIAALAYGQKSWEAMPIVYDLQDEYIRLHKSPIYPDFQYLLQVGLGFRAAYYTISDGISTKGYRVKNYSFNGDIWTDSKFETVVYTKASQVDEPLTYKQDKAKSQRRLTRNPKGLLDLTSLDVSATQESQPTVQEPPPGVSTAEAFIDLTAPTGDAKEESNSPKTPLPPQEVFVCRKTDFGKQICQWGNVCLLAGYDDWTKLNLIQFDSSDPIHFYLLEAKVQNLGFKYLLLIAYLDLASKNTQEHHIVVLHKAALTEKAFIKLAARRNFVGLFKRWYHTQTIMHRTVGQKILFDEIELEKYEYLPPKEQLQLAKGMDASTKTTEDNEAVVLLSTRHAAFKHVKHDERDKFEYYKSNVYFDQKYGFHYLRAFVFRKTKLIEKVDICTQIGKILPTFGENRILYTSLAKSGNKWRTVVMITKADFKLRDMTHSALAYGSRANPVEPADHTSEVNDTQPESSTQDEEESIAKLSITTDMAKVLMERLAELEKPEAEAQAKLVKKETRVKQAEKENLNKNAEEATEATKPPSSEQDKQKLKETQEDSTPAKAEDIPNKQTPEEGPNPPSTETDKKPTKKKNRLNHYKVFRYQKYDEDKDLKKWVLEETPAYTGWIPIKIAGLLKDKKTYNRLQSYLWDLAYNQYNVAAYWTVLLVKERTKFALFTSYYFVFGYHGLTKDHKSNGQKYFCAIIHKDYKYMLVEERKTKKHGVVIAFAFDLDPLDVIGTAMDLEDAYLAQQNDIMGVAHLASLKLKQAGNLFPTLQHCVQRDKQYREFHFKLNTNVDTIGYFVLMYTYDVHKKAWIGCDTTSFETGDERHKQLKPYNDKILTNVATTAGTPTSNTNTPTTAPTPTTPIVPSTREEIEAQLPELMETYQKLKAPQHLPLWQRITTLDVKGLEEGPENSQNKWKILKNKEFQQRIDELLKGCSCTIINEEDEVLKIKYVYERNNGRYSLILGVSEKSYFFVHTFDGIILFYRSDLPTYITALSALEHYMTDVVDWISVKGTQAAIPPEILDVQNELAIIKVDQNLPIAILYYAEIPDIGFLAIFQIWNAHYLLRLDTNTGQKNWGFKCQRVETLLRIRKSYVMTDDGWNAYDHHVKLIWVPDPYPGNRKIPKRNHGGTKWYEIIDIFGHLGKLRECALGKLYRKIQNPLKFEERKNRLRIWLADSLQKDPEIVQYGIYNKVDEHSAKFVTDINGAGGQDLSSNMKQMFALISIKPFIEKPKEGTTSAPKILEIFKVAPKTTPVSNPQLDRYQVVNVLDFMNVDIDFSLGGYSSPFFPVQELAQDAVGLENMLNGY